MGKDTIILVIDDDEAILEIITQSLNTSGFVTLSAQSGKEGLEIAAARKPDAIILDWMMPEMNGNEVLKTLKNDNALKNIPVMMLTAKDEINNISESLTMGAKEYIVKPFDLENMVIRLRNMIAY
tara:strand:- start:260 stop:634 length:375 start_codon:yes stop_codon:yes gene_type:complete